MSDMVWLVTQGEFDDYEIHHVFRDEETAMRHVKQWNAVWPEGGSMERRVDPRDIESDLPELAVFYHAEWWSHDDPDIGVGEVVHEVAELLGQLDHLNARYFDNGTATFRCSSLSRARAVKIVGDARAKYLAQEAGL